MLSEQENTYLAKWLNGDLNEQELQELKNLPEYDEYKKIVDGLEYFEPPSFDLDKSLMTTLEKLDQPKKGKVIKLRPLLYVAAVAASVVLIFGLFFNTITYTSDPGKQLAVMLPDGSTVDLNAASTLTHKRFFWSQDRKITLTGEAYFEVTHGSRFTVSTTLGDVQVLGTKFNVKARKNQFEVGCYEGKVQVSANDQQKILQKGEAASLKNKTLTKEKLFQNEPLWKKGESIFNSVPLGQVLDELERQYNITFRRNQIDQNLLFTGGFNYRDLNIALESVLVPMGIEYVVNGKIISLSTQ